MILGTPIPNNILFPKEYIQSILRLRGEYEIFFEEGPSVAINRNKLLERARLMGEDILLIDSDSVFSVEDVKKIETHLQDNHIVAGVCMVGHIPYYPAIYRKEGEAYRPKRMEEGLFQVDAAGTAFCGISKEVVDTLVQPFEIKKDRYGHEYGNDISFCIEAIDSGYKILCDSSIRIGHIRSHVIQVEDIDYEK